MRIARRIADLPPYLFAGVNQRIAAKRAAGHDVISLGAGDVALVPSPGYPVYQVGALLAGARCHFVPLRAEDGFLPRLPDIPEEVARSAKLLWLNYPNN